MIFIAGVQPKTRRLSDNPRGCPSCGSPEAYLTRVDQYLSIFFIPVIPIRRGEPVLSCENCGAVNTESGQALWIEGTHGGEICHRCNRVLERDFSYCPYCGTPLHDR
ncbi:MAG: zinc-ribbon domain-containing protein [Proteobacteria bacterium]|nr:zinc-ribbon domain-containing protein [Pseudomonadota bacterium]